MALWSLTVEIGEERFNAQLTASEPHGAIGELLASRGFRELAAKALAGARSAEFTIDDILYLIPMEGLVNMHLCQLRREGKYASVVMAPTEAQPNA